MGRIAYGKDGGADLNVASYKPPHVGEPGHEAWLFTQRRNITREGPEAYPLPGISASFVPVDVAFTFLTFPMASLLESGVSMPNIQHYLERPGGSQFFLQHGKVVRVPKLHTLFVPHGLMVIPFWMNLDKKDTRAWGHCWHLANLDAKLADPAEKNVTLAVRQFNEAYLVSEASKLTSFKPRKDAFQACCDAALAMEPVE